MNPGQKAALYSQLATLARAGVSLRQATASLHPYFREAGMQTIAQSLEDGRPLSASMENAGFQPFEIRMILAGENTGRLEHIFQQLAEYWDSEAILRKTVLRQSLYPLLLLHLAILAFPIGLLLKSVPLYLLTVIGYFLVFYLGIFMVAATLYWFWRQPDGQRLMLRLPILGRTLRSAAAWRWIQVAEIEYSAGIPLPESIRDAWLATGWIQGESCGQTAHARLNEGENLSALVREWPELPRDWEMFIMTGETSGKLHESLAQLVIEARRNWANTQKFLGEWIPRIFYLVILLFVACKIIGSALDYLLEINKLLEM